MGTRSETEVDGVGRELLERIDSLERLGPLEPLGVGDLPTEVFERLTLAATQTTGAPVALAVLVDDEQHVVVAETGLQDSWLAAVDVPSTPSMCRMVAQSGVPLIVADARKDARVRDHEAVRELGVVAYAGMPLRARGECVGSLCLVDSEPRAWSPSDLLLLGELADAATAELDGHLARADRADARQRSDERYRLLVTAMVDGVVMQDRFGVIEECNPAAERILGLTADQMTGRSSLDRRWRSIHADGRDMPGTEHPSMRTLETGIPLRDEVMGICKPSGELTWVSVSTEPLSGDDGEIESVVVIFTDITARKQAQEHRDQQLAEQHALRELATLVASQASPGAVFAAAAKHAAHVLGANAGGVARLNARAGARLVGAWVPPQLPMPSIGEPVDLEAGTATGSVLKTGRPAARPRPCAYLRRTGSGSSLASPIVVDGELWGALSVAYDSVIGKAGTDEKLERLGRFAELVGLGISSAEAREQLSRQATIDHLTGLQNQRSFSDLLDQEVLRSAGDGQPLSLVVFDIDHFKLVNDTHGHVAGNDVLVEFAERLNAERIGDQVLARVGGEEFALIMPGTDRADAFAAAERIRRRIQATPFTGAGHLTTSAGVCELSDADDARQLFRHADMALYWAKTEGRNATFAYEHGRLELLSGDEQARRLKDATTLAAIRALATAVDAKDPSTQRHSERVAELTAELATQAGWEPGKVALLRDAALVHDIGKIGIPDHVLLKPGKLTGEEYDQIKLHSALGAQMAEGVLTREQTEWIRHHHERFDGRGYPDAIAGTDISEGARLMALADSWDAMTVARPYGTPRTQEEALAEVQRSAGTQFCPDAVRVFLELYADGRLPEGTRPLN